MMVTRKNPWGSGTSDEEILMIILEEEATTTREVIPEMFGSIKTMLFEIFDERYVVVTEAAATVATTVIVAARPHWG